MFQISRITAATLTLICACQTVSAQTIATGADAEALDSAATTLATATAITSAPTLATATPSASEKYARTYQTWLTQANKPYANQLGSGNGSGVVVGVADSGVQASHIELRGQIVAGYNALNGSTDITDQMGHGTHVSGIIAGTLASGSLFEGVAPGAKIAMAKVFATGSSDTATIGRGIDWLVNTQKTPIVSLSLGASAPSLQTNMQNAVTKGVLVTAALGNDGFTNAASWPAEFAKATWANGQIIAVGALDAANKRASFSNYDATLAKWTVYAPGVNVLSSYPTATANGYAYMSGTSMATPVVAGQAALIKSNWNFLVASDIAQIIFQSATHLCSDAVAASTCASRTTADNVYGWGLVNIGASLQPIGSLNITSKTGAAVSFAGTSLAAPKSGLATGLTGVSTMAVDKFNRGFTVNLASAVAKSVGITTSVPAASTGTTVQTATGVKFDAEYSAQATTQSALGLASDNVMPTLGKASLRFTNANGTAYGFGTGRSEGAFFGLESTGMTPLNLGSEAGRFNAPYFALANNASHVGYGFQLREGTWLRVGVVAESPSATTALLGATPTGSEKTIATMELQSNWGAWTTVASLGSLQEQNSVLGVTGTGALAVEGAAQTQFLSIAGSRPLSDKVRISAMASMGWTSDYANKNAASLFSNMGASTSAAWSLGLSRSDVLRDGDRLGLTVAMPLRTMSGSMDVSTAVSQDQNTGALQYANQSVNLAPTGSERDVELSYARPLRHGASVSALVQLRMQPGHDASAANQTAIGMRYAKTF